MYKNNIYKISNIFLIISVIILLAIVFNHIELEPEIIEDEIIIDNTLEKSEIQRSITDTEKFKRINEDIRKVFQNYDVQSPIFIIRNDSVYYEITFDGARNEFYNNLYELEKKLNHISTDIYHCWYNSGYETPVEIALINEKNKEQILLTMRNGIVNYRYTVNGL